MSAEQIQAEIDVWQSQNPPRYVWDVDDYQNFWSEVELGTEINLPSGKVEYVDVEINGDDALAVFTVDETTYALKGYSNSWNSAWDGGVVNVSKETFTVTRWTEI